MIWHYLLIPAGVVCLAIIVFLLIQNRSKCTQIRKRKLKINGKEQYLDLEEAIEELTNHTDDELIVDNQLASIEEIFRKFAIPELSTFYYELTWARGAYYWIRSEQKDGIEEDLIKARKDMLSIMDHPMLILDPHSQVRLRGNIEHVELDLKMVREKRRRG